MVVTLLMTIYTDSHKEFRIELIEKAVFPIV